MVRVVGVQEQIAKALAVARETMGIVAGICFPTCGLFSLEVITPVQLASLEVSISVSICTNELVKLIMFCYRNSMLFKLQSGSELIYLLIRK